jgi:hypothetical protein
MVPETAKKFFPGMALGFSDSRVSLHITDGIKWTQDAEEGTYDVIIVDSSDPVGPAEVLFQKVRPDRAIAVDHRRNASPPTHPRFFSRSCGPMRQLHACMIGMGILKELY